MTSSLLSPAAVPASAPVTASCTPAGWGTFTSNQLPELIEFFGKKIGVQAANEPIWKTFLKANNLDASKITKVPVQFDPTPLAQKQVDGWLSYVTNEPNLL